MKKCEENLKSKINEAKFFIELIKVIEINKKTLTHQRSIEEEASYLLSAVLNTFFSITEYIGSWENQKVKDFRNNNQPIIYKQSKDGGLRHTSTHVSHIGINQSGYVPSTDFVFYQKPKLIIEKEDNNKKNLHHFNIPQHFNIEIDGKLTDVFDFCTIHLHALEKFLTDNNYI